MTKELTEQIAALPTTPGIYRYFDQAGRLLYIGKAINLKRRVSSYWQKRTEGKTAELVARIDQLDFVETDSALEALILEANEINAKQPPFNVRSKDDKTFVMIGITKEDFPAIVIFRPTQQLKEPLQNQFGPYPSTDQARIALKIIRKILPFRTTCKIPFSRTLRARHLRSVTHEVSRKSGCLDYQLGLCPGPCADAITRQNYAKVIRKVVLLLQSKKGQLIKQLMREMKRAARDHDFEQATKFRNQAFALQHIQDVALLRNEKVDSYQLKIDSLPRRIEAYDISNLGESSAVGSMIVLTNGRPDKNQYRKFRIKTVTGQNDLKMMREVLTRRFRHLEWPLPDLLVIDGGMNHLRIAQGVLKRSKLALPIIAVAKGPNRDRLDLYPSDTRLRTTDYGLLTIVRRARDEAHRFAIRYHRARRDINFLETET